jgi:hypothetical protein
VAALRQIANGEDGAWLDLLAAGIGWVPGVGDAIKAGIRGSQRAIDAGTEVARGAARRVDDVGPKGKTGTTETAGARRVFTSTDPIVGSTATAIDKALPGAVKDVNVPIKNSGIGLSSDADIMLKNGDVIEVKSGGGKGATTQVSNQTKIIGESGEVIVYGPDLKPSVIKGMQSSGTKVFTNLDELVAYIKSKGL